MKKFNDNSISKLLLDEGFVSWVRSGCPDNAPWARRLSKQSQSREAAALAAAVIRNIEFRECEISDEDLNSLISSVRQSMAPPRRAASVFRFFGEHQSLLRASALVLFSASIITLIVSTWQANNNQSLISKNTPLQRKNHYALISAAGPVKLPDGSCVILKTGSSLLIAQEFGLKKREVYLNGEASFEVKKDPSRQFIVRSNGLTTRVYGTSFSISATRGDSVFKVIVSTGTVSVSIAEATQKSVLPNQKTLQLTANQQASYDVTKARLVKADLSRCAPLSAALAKAQFDFVETPLSEVAQRLSEAYQVPIICENEFISRCPVTASLGELSFYEKLSLICRALNAGFETREGKVIIRGRGCEAGNTTAATR